MQGKKSICQKRFLPNGRKVFPFGLIVDLIDVKKGMAIFMEYIKLPHNHGEDEQTAIHEQTSKVTNFQVVADIFKQLGDPTRIRIFWLLCHCEECVINISAMMNMSSPAVSHHLRPLKNSGLIVSRRDGKEVYYRAADTPQSRLLHLMIEQVMGNSLSGKVKRGGQ